MSRFEIDRGNVSYTVDTLEHLAGLLPDGTELFFITGADAVLDILTWKDPARVLELATFIAATRPGYDLSKLAGLLEELRSATVGLVPEARVKIMEVPGAGDLLQHDQRTLGRGQGPSATWCPTRWLSSSRRAGSTHPLLRTLVAGVLAPCERRARTRTFPAAHQTPGGIGL